MPPRTTPTHRLTPVPFTRVTFTDAFWAPRLRTNRERTLPAIFHQCEESGRLGAYAVAREPGAGTEASLHPFWDSDVAKFIEAASFCLATQPDAHLDALLDDVIARVVSVQQPDGYLNAYFTAIKPDKRWTNLHSEHELYCAGHLIEAAVAHYQATGKRTLLDAMCRNADHIDDVFGDGEGQKPGYDGHPEIELALVKLYRVTGDARYLRLSQFFVDARGRQPHYFDLEARARGEEPNPTVHGGSAYSHSLAHAPVREQSEVIGHAVRAMYLFSAMADLAGKVGEADLYAACLRLWDDLTLRKTFLTGGIGSARYNEGFTRPYDLPNEAAYAETCAAIGLVFWAHRLLQLDLDGKYADMMERALYNGAVSGVSLDGEQFFYVNPLASSGEHHRQTWFNCACCPPNLARLLASLGDYVYSTGEASIAVHLYAESEAKMAVAGTTLTLRQQTRYPWEGEVRLTLDLAAPTAFTLSLRVPDWCRRHALAVNGQPVEATSARGYAAITRTWQTGDCVELCLDMPVERIAAHPDVAQDVGRVALQRGPIVFCLEDADHAVPVHRILLPADAELGARFIPDLLNGIVVIEGSALAEEVVDDALYYPREARRRRPVALRAIPYCAWDNRDPGGMAVWLPEA